MSILVISHFAQNTGTTDHFVDYLDHEHIAFSYLRHPLPESSVHYSQLFEGNPASTSPSRSYKSRNFFPIEIIRELWLNTKTVISRRKRVSTVICFGSINCLWALPAAKFLRKKVLFWGVDYSRQRFRNPIFNNFYRWSETVSCKYSDQVVQPAPLQQEARIRLHGLDPKKSLVIPNGIESVEPLSQSSSAAPALVYSGSISDQHGVLQLVELLANLKTGPKLYIFGTGDRSVELTEMILKRPLETQVKYFGHRTTAEILKIIQESPYRFIGIAPYAKGGKDHADYGDSLKVKDYLSWGIPFIASDVVRIEPDLTPFGRVYSSDSDLPAILTNLDNMHSNDPQAQSATIRRYEWGNLFGKLLKQSAV